MPVARIAAFWLLLGRLLVRRVGALADTMRAVEQGHYDVEAPGRKEVKINGRRIMVVDVHAHCVFPEVATRVPGVAISEHLPRLARLAAVGTPAMPRSSAPIPPIKP